MKPASEKVTTQLEVFTVKEPIEEIEVVVNGQKVKQWRYQCFHFTTAEKPVTYEGVQYIPLSYFDRVRWDAIVNR
jgi:hypothetical protein